MKNKRTNIKAIVLLISVFLILPLTAQAASILYSVTGTGTEYPTTDIRNITGYMVISDEPSVTNLFPTNSDSMITYQIETFTLTLEGIGSISGRGSFRFEEYRWGFAELRGMDGSRPVNDEFFRHIQYYYSDGSPYGSPNDTTSFANYAELAPLITSSGDTGYFGDFDFDQYASFNITLNAVGTVPLPAAVWLFGSGLIGLIGLARRKTS